MFLGLDRGSNLAGYAGSENSPVWDLSGLIKNILICVLKMNEGLTGLERHESE